MLVLLITASLWPQIQSADVVTKGHSINALKQDIIARNEWTLLGPLNRIAAKGFYDWDFYGRWRFFPWDEYSHYPSQTTSFKIPAPLSKTIPGSDQTIHPDDMTPDFRMPEPPYRALDRMFFVHHQEDRYYRVSPLYLQLMGRWFGSNMFDRPRDLGCYCVTVFRRLTPLGMCAILSLRHILTTASSTDLILRRPRYKKKKTLVNILGFWYETDTYRDYWENASYYGSPSRITYHPMWTRPEVSNRSNPFPAYYDLSVWATTYKLVDPGILGALPWWTPTSLIRLQRTIVCGRCSGKTRYPFDSPGMNEADLTILIGAQFVMDIGRHPFPWFKYAIRTTTGKRNPCPKVEWGWFHCIEMKGQVGKLGHESGGILHITYRGIYNRRYSGLAGLNAFSMRLRSKYFVNYYTVLERHAVIDYLYSAYMGQVPWEFLDFRFWDSKWIGFCLINPWYGWVKIQGDYNLYYNPYPENISPRYYHFILPGPYGYIQSAIYATFVTPYEPIWW